MAESSLPDRETLQNQKLIHVIKLFSEINARYAWELRWKHRVLIRRRLTSAAAHKEYPALKGHVPSHILSAQELADALDRYSRSHWNKCSHAIKLKGSIHTNRSQLGIQKGIVFIQNGWGATDHIDLRNG